LRQPEVRERILRSPPLDPSFPIFRASRNFDRIFTFRTPDYEPAPAKSIAAIASENGIAPEDVAYDYLTSGDGTALLYAALANYMDGNLEAQFDMVSDPETVIGLGDGGAHYGLICDASYPTFLLTHFVRDRQGRRLSLPQAIKVLTADAAEAIGFTDRGVVAPGYRADLNIIDLQAMKLEMPYASYDLPGGGRRIDQGAQGYRATIVGGAVIAREGRATGVLPGQVLRGARGSLGTLENC
jgi:N-acyl-D-amino-acid deacylase